MTTPKAEAMRRTIAEDRDYWHDEAKRLAAELSAAPPSPSVADAWREHTLQDAWNKINGWVRSGPLKGNGCDEIAFNNGLIQSCNFIMEMMVARPTPAPGAAELGRPWKGTWEGTLSLGERPNNCRMVYSGTAWIAEFATAEGANAFVTLANNAPRPTTMGGDAPHGDDLVKRLRTCTVYRTEARGLKSDLEKGNYNDSDQPQFEACVFSDGRVAQRWLTSSGSMVWWDSWELLCAVHIYAHPDYGTRIEWHDQEAM